MIMWGDEGRRMPRITCVYMQYKLMLLLAFFEIPCFPVLIVSLLLRIFCVHAFSVFLFFFGMNLG